MSRARVVDESIRAKAIELRSKGLSYREIARELGISVATAFRLVKSVEGASAPVSAGSANSGDMDFKKFSTGSLYLFF
jgi:orotate phosphoribosyltransferase-like protein